MNIKNLGTFKDISISDIEIFLKFFTKYPQNFCDYNIFNLLAWSIIYDYKWLIYKDRLLIYNKQNDYIFRPIGENFEVEELIFISDSFKNCGYKGNYCFFEICHLENYSNLVNYFDIVESIDNANYIYLSEKLSQLKGRKLHGKRNLISQFIRNYPDYRVINIEKENLNCESFKKCIELSEEWLNQKESTLGYNDKILDLINIEQRVLKNSCNFFKYLDIGLTFIEVKREIAAFAIYSKQNQEMITLHFEKYNKEFIGSAQVINSYTAKFIENKYKYINREDDLGIPQLRFAKNSYLPDKLLIPYSLNRKD